MRASSIELTARKSHYGVDGTGRDTYINFDNGGNFRGYGLEGRGKFERGTFENNRVYAKAKCDIAGRPLHYIGDGTGRDVYIITNEGGVCNQSMGQKFNFLASLRQPIIRANTKKDDIFTRTQDTWKTKGTSQKHYYQDNLSRKLSAPKKYDDPYRQLRSAFKQSIGYK